MSRKQALAKMGIIDLTKHMNKRDAKKTVKEAVSLVKLLPKAKIPDMSDIISQEHAKRAIEVATVGGFNVLLVGSPGNGKSMLAEVYVDMLNKINNTNGIIYISVSSTIKSIQQTHAGNDGQDTIIHIKDLPEVKRDAMLYAKELSEHYSIPIIATMQPCPCGCLGHPNRQCTCTPAQVIRYRSNIPSGVVDMFDVHIEVPPVNYREMVYGIQVKSKGETSETVLQRILEARELYRQNHEKINPDEDAINLLTTACQRLGFSVKTTTKILKVSRAVANMDGSDIIRPYHISEAIQYRILDRKL